MRPLTAEDEATLRAIAARHGYTPRHDFGDTSVLFALARDRAGKARFTLGTRAPGHRDLANRDRTDTSPLRWRGVAARHGYVAARGPHAGDGSASRLLAALLADEVVTLALAPAERRCLVAWQTQQRPPTRASAPSCGAWRPSCARPSPPTMTPTLTARSRAAG